MTYYDKIVENPDVALDDIAARRGLSQEEMARRLSAIREAAGEGSHVTLSQAQSIFDEECPPPRAVLDHVNGCAYCQALVDGLHPSVVDGAVTRASEVLFGAKVRTSYGLGSALWPKFAVVSVLFLIIGVVSGIAFSPAQDPSGALSATNQSYNAVRGAFIQGEPAVGYERLRMLMAQSGLDRASLAALKRMESIEEEPTSDEAVFEIIALLLDHKLNDVVKYREAAELRDIMVGLAQIGDHPRALIALRAYLQRSRAPAEVLAEYDANVDMLAVAATRSYVNF